MIGFAALMFVGGIVSFAAYLGGLVDERGIVGLVIGLVAFLWAIYEEVKQ